MLGLKPVVAVFVAAMVVGMVSGYSMSPHEALRIGNKMVEEAQQKGMQDVKGKEDLLKRAKQVFSIALQAKLKEAYPAAALVRLSLKEEVEALKLMREYFGENTVFVFNKQKDESNIVSWVLDIAMQMEEAGVLIRMKRFLDTAVKEGIIRSRYQRPTAILDFRLPSMGYMDEKQLWWAKEVISKWETFRGELRQLIADNYLEPGVLWEGIPIDPHNAVPAAEALLYFPVIERGSAYTDADKSPQTRNALLKIGEVASLSIGSSFFIELRANSEFINNVGQTNYRLTMLLPLYGSKGAQIIVGDETRDLIDGKPVVFQDSYVWDLYSGEASLGALVIEAWHPHLGNAERFGSVKQELSYFIPKVEEAKIEAMIAKFLQEKQNQAMAKSMTGRN